MPQTEFSFDNQEGLSDPDLVKPLGCFYAENGHPKGSFAEGCLFFNGSHLYFIDKEGKEHYIVVGRLGHPLEPHEMARLFGEEIYTEEQIAEYRRYVERDQFLGSDDVGFDVGSEQLKENVNVNTLQPSLRFKTDAVCKIPGGKIYIEDIRADISQTTDGKHMATFVAPLYHGMDRSGSHHLSLGIARICLDDGLNQEVNFVEVCTESVKNPSIPLRYEDGNKVGHVMLARGMSGDLMKKILILDNQSDDIFDEYHIVSELEGIDLDFDFPESLQRLAISSNYLPVDLNEIYGSNVPRYLQNRLLYMVMMHYVEKSDDGLESYKAGLAFISTINNIPSTFNFEGITLDFVTKRNYPAFWDVETFLHGKREITYPTSTISHHGDKLLFSGGIGDQAISFCEADYKKVLGVGRSAITRHYLNEQMIAS